MRKFLLLASLGLSACVTNDFKVVDALQVGMTEEQARSTIASYGFDRNEVLQRPESGWSETYIDWVDMAARAHHAEKQLGQRVSKVEYYPVFHGILGYGQLFLFYDEDRRLATFYRRQIN